MRIILSILLFASLFINQAYAVGLSVDKSQLEAAKNSYIIVFKGNVSRKNVSRLANDIARTHAGSVRFTYSNTIKGFSAMLPAAAVEKIANNPNVAYVENNGIAWASVIPEEAKSTKAYGRPTSGSEPDQVTPWGIERVGGPLDGTGKQAWVIDTGIDLDHPDLNVGVGENFVLIGKKSTDDGHGHGTHVAGIIAAINNTIDVVGVASNATVHPVRVLDDRGSGTIDSVIAGIDFVAANAQPGDVANMSLGAPGHFQSLHDAVLLAADKGILFSIAAGNDSDDANNYEPAHVEHPLVYTISAVEVRDIFASFSNYMNPPIDFAAPGVGVLSTKADGGVVSYSGTSMAAPHVAGLLLFSTPVQGGYAISDPDSSPDPIAYHQ